MAENENLERKTTPGRTDENISPKPDDSARRRKPRESFIAKRKRKEAAEAKNRAKAARFFLPEDAGYVVAEGLESTEKFKQKDLLGAVDLNTASSIFELPLPDLGPYVLDYTRNGRWLILSGRKGHLALIDAIKMNVQMEVQLQDTIRDVCALHNHNLVAVAQRKYVYIYSDHGEEVHCMRQHIAPNKLQFLKHHYLLASIGQDSHLRYHDISKGELVANLHTRHGPCDVLAQNPYNAIIHCGHSNGVVSLWCPTVGTPLVSMLTHRGPVSCLSVDYSGKHMVTAGLDGRVKVWDLRTYKELHVYGDQRQVHSMSISQRGLLALGSGPHVTVWKDALNQKAKKPYVKHTFTSGTKVKKMCFRPYEDSLGIGHRDGFSAGEPNFDTYAENPFETLKQRREREVHSLLDKLQPETISLDPNIIGTIDQDRDLLRVELQTLQKEASKKQEKPDKKKKKRKKSERAKLLRALAKKQSNVIDSKVVQLKEKLRLEREASRKAKEDETRDEMRRGAPKALSKFFK